MAASSTPQSECRVVMHVDMDCFFAAVSCRNRPELLPVPLAVAHSNHTAGHSEISCVNYAARACGVRAGCWMADAKRRCALEMPGRVAG
jgi:DNA repair protein REV1